MKMSKVVAVVVLIAMLLTTVACAKIFPAGTKVYSHQKQLIYVLRYNSDLPVLGYEYNDKGVKHYKVAGTGSQMGKIGYIRCSDVDGKLKRLGVRTSGWYVDNCDYANVRNEQMEIIGKVKSGTRVNVVGTFYSETNGRYYKVEKNGNYGYIYCELMTHVR